MSRPNDGDMPLMTDDSAPASFIPIDVVDGDQPVLSGLAPLIPGALLAHRYRLVHSLGRLGSATRWEAADESLSRSALVLAFPDDEEAPRILEAARQASGAMDGRFLRILDTGQDADGAYIVSEWLPGCTLTELLADGPLSPVETAWITREVAVGLASVHSLHLFHLRLNPSDIIITNNGSVKISGLMVAAALTENSRDQNLTRADMEQIDVAGCGRILYACLTATWPGTPVPSIASTPRTTAGLPTPSHLQPGVSPELNQLAYRILSSEAPNHLSKAQDVADTMGASLGAASGTGALARRVENCLKRSVPSTAETGEARRPTILHLYPDPAAAEMSAAVPSGGQPRPVVTGNELTGDPTQPLKQADRPDGAKVMSTTQVRRWSVGFIILVSLVVIAIITSVVIGLYHSTREPQASPTPTISQRPISQAIVFDPTADGGNGTENEDKVGLSFDGDQTTVWPTADYDTGYITKRKPGVGLIYDLGQPASVSQLTVFSTIMPTSVTLYVPPVGVTEQDQLPLDTVTKWTSVTTLPVAASPATTTFTPTTSRYFLVYMTQLQLGDDGKDHGDLAEVSFAG